MPADTHSCSACIKSDTGASRAKEADNIAGVGWLIILLLAIGPFVWLGVCICIKSCYVDLASCSP